MFIENKWNNLLSVIYQIKGLEKEDKEENEYRKEEKIDGKTYVCYSMDMLKYREKLSKCLIEFKDEFMSNFYNITSEQSRNFYVDSTYDKLFKIREEKKKNLETYNIKGYNHLTVPILKELYCEAEIQISILPVLLNIIKDLRHSQSLNGKVNNDKILSNEIEFISFKQSENQLSQILTEQSEDKQVYSSFSDIFNNDNWEKYIIPLTKCNPKLLEKVGIKFKFIGNKKTQIGCVAGWFKFLKSKGIINQSASRDALANILTLEIENYKVSGATIDNISTTYKKIFQKQLEENLTNIN